MGFATCVLFFTNCDTKQLHNTHQSFFWTVNQSLAGIRLRVMNKTHHTVSNIHADHRAHHVPDPQDDGSCADMATQAAAGGEPAVPRGYHLIVPVYRRRWSVSRRRASVLAVRLAGCSDLSVTNQPERIWSSERQVSISLAEHFRFFGRNILCPDFLSRYLFAVYICFKYDIKIIIDK